MLYTEAAYNNSREAERTFFIIIIPGHTGSCIFIKACLLVIKGHYILVYKNWILSSTSPSGSLTPGILGVIPSEYGNG